MTQSSSSVSSPRFPMHRLSPERKNVSLLPCNNQWPGYELHPFAARHCFLTSKEAVCSMCSMSILGCGFASTLAFTLFLEQHMLLRLEFIWCAGVAVTQNSNQPGISPRPHHTKAIDHGHDNQRGRCPTVLLSHPQVARDSQLYR